MENQFKPNKKAFIFSRILYKITLVFVVFVFLGWLIDSISSDFNVVLYLFPLFLIINALLYYLELVVYRKSFYTFEENKIIQKGGTLFSDFETELNIKNITHVKLRLPFLENKIFNTGHVDIESAGSSSSEIHFCSMDGIESVHSRVVELMQKNGFNLNKDELIMTEKPSGLGVFFEVFKNFFSGVIVILYIASDGFDSEFQGETEIAILLGAVILFFVFIFQVFVFFDLKKRVYKIYKNIITYNEGFLSKNYAFLPFENLTDTTTTQTFVDKVFGLYDVKISCQGSKHEILFKNIANGEIMSDKLDELINNHKQPQSAYSATGVPLPPSSNISQADNVSSSEPVKQKDVVNYDYSFTGNYKMNTVRTLLWSIILLIVAVFVFFIFSLIFGLTIDIVILSFSTFLPILFVMLVGLVKDFIRIKSTSFSIKSNSINYTYNFLETKNIDFSIDKIMGVVVQRNFIDDWFNTVSIKFLSIGSSQVINFKNIKKEDNLIKNTLSKIGISQEEEVFKINSQFSLKEALKSSLFTFVSVVLGVIAFVVFIWVVSIISKTIAIIFFFIIIIFLSLSYLYKKECYKRTSITFFKNFVCFQTGWLFRRYYYARYDNIKDIIIIKYPFSKEGSIRFSVAGEQLVGYNQHKTITSNSFKINYVEDVQSKDELIDYILYKKPDKNELTVFQSNIDKYFTAQLITKPCFYNVLVPNMVALLVIDLILFLIFFAFSVSLVIIVITLLLIDVLLMAPFVINEKMKSYEIDNYRVLSKTGIFYKKQTSVIFNKIDFISNNQKFLNKIFKNGNVIINTVGSSKAELVVRNIPDFKEFYAKMKDLYAGRVGK